MAKSELTPAAVDAATALARALGVRFEDVCGKRRRRDICAARHTIARMLRQDYHGAYPAIARLLRRHHASVIYAVKKGGPHADD